YKARILDWAGDCASGGHRERGRERWLATAWRRRGEGLRTVNGPPAGRQPTSSSWISRVAMSEDTTRTRTLVPGSSSPGHRAVTAGSAIWTIPDGPFPLPLVFPPFPLLLPLVPLAGLGPEMTTASNS